MELLRDYLIEERAEILDNGIRLIAIGDTARLPDFVNQPLQDMIRDSAGRQHMILCLALSYGGRDAIVDAIRSLCERVQAGALLPEEIDGNCLGEVFQTQGLPPLDLVIRTSGERRISNFLLWESVHTKFHTTETLWPEFGREELLSILHGCKSVRGT